MIKISDLINISKTDLFRRIICCALFLLMFILIYLQYSKVWIYYDDYGYLSLNYALNSWDVPGHEYTFGQMLHFIRWSFVYSNGRQAVMFLYLLIFKIGGLTAVRTAVAVFAALTALLPVLLLKLTEHRFRLSIAASLFLVSCFALLGITVQSDGAYWFAAAFPYIVPALLIYLPLLCIALMYKGKNVPFVACIAAAFAAGFTQEQYYVADIMLTACMLAGTFLPRQYIGGHKKSRGLINIEHCRMKIAAMLAAAFAGGLPILLCPAAHNRLRNSSWYDLSIAGRLNADLTEIMRIFYSEYNVYYVWIVFAVMLLLSAVLILNTENVAARICHSLFAVFTVFMIIYFRQSIRIGGFSGRNTPMCILYTVSMSLELLIFLLTRKKYILASVYMAASAALGCLILVPSTDIQFRCMLPYIFMTMPVFAYIVQSVARHLRYIAALIMAAFWLMGMHNMHNIYKGYSINAAVNEYNDTVMQAAADEYHKSGTTHEIMLYQLPDNRCRGRMQYEPGYEGVSKWMAEYYDLPREIELIWLDDTLTSGIIKSS